MEKLSAVRKVPKSSKYLGDRLKMISMLLVKALMHSLYNRKDPIQTLYVREAEYTYDIGQVFSKARAEAPCMLVLEVNC